MKQFGKKIILGILEWEARRIITRYNPKIIAVVGSVGKTSTKDAIATALSSRIRVGKSKKSYNSEFGVPLAILGSASGGSQIFAWLHILFEGLLLSLFTHEYPEILVLEVGADRQGDILRTAGWLKTDVVVVTAYGDVPVHIEYFGSKDDLVSEDKEILKTLRPDGLLIVNGDDADSASFRDVWSGTVQSISLKKGDVVGSGYKIAYTDHVPKGFTVQVEAGEEKSDIVIEGALGEQLVYPVLAGVAVGLYLNIPLREFAQIFGSHHTPPGRMRIIAGKEDVCLIDDTYNASPTAVIAALWTLRDIKTKGRKIAVLGDMMELGHFSVDQHKKIGRLSATICDVLVTVGVRSMVTANEALEAGMKAESVTHVEDSEKAKMLIEKMLKSKDIVLVKGSQSMRMEKIIAHLMVEQGKRTELLVRQDGEWEGR